MVQLIYSLVIIVCIPSNKYLIIHSEVVLIITLLVN
jgi:hypothetical protein